MKVRGSDDNDRGVLLLLQFQRGRVHAIALTGRLGAVVKDMAEMPSAFGAEGFRSPHEEAPVLFGRDALIRKRLPEARPAGARLELRVGREERIPAAGADERPRIVVVPVLAGEGAL